MNILAIETSCDETSAAIVKNGTEILGNVVATSSDLHLKTGGIVPEIAAREQLRCVLPVIKEVFQKAFKSRGSEIVKNNIDAIAVTTGPGLIGSLLIGVETARVLSYLWNKPLIPVNHLTAHLYANWLNTGKKNPAPKFPALCLVVSGGHTEMIIIKNHNNYLYLGGTRDDACGEAFDKTARLLQIAQYNGGPAIAKRAQEYLDYLPSQKPISFFPRPMINTKTFEFSFSGLKTAVFNKVLSLKKDHLFNDLAVKKFSYEIQEAITDVLANKILLGIEKFQPKSVLIAGGVAANQRLKEKLELKIKTKHEVGFFIPPPSLCTDNAAYIASCAFFNNHPLPWQKVSANPAREIID